MLSLRQRSVVIARFLGPDHNTFLNIFGFFALWTFSWRLRSNEISKRLNFVELFRFGYSLMLATRGLHTLTYSVTPAMPLLPHALWNIEVWLGAQASLDSVTHKSRSSNSLKFRVWTCHYHNFSVTIICRCSTIAEIVSEKSSKTLVESAPKLFERAKFWEELQEHQERERLKSRFS